MPFAPRCVDDVAAMVIAGRSRPSNCECLETMLAGELRCGVVEQLSLDWPDVSPLDPAPKGRRGPFVRADVVTVPARRGTVSRVKVITHGMRGGDPHVVRQYGVQGSAQCYGCPLLRHAHADRLAARMDSCIGAS